MIESETDERDLITNIYQIPLAAMEKRYRRELRLDVAQSTVANIKPRARLPVGVKLAVRGNNEWLFRLKTSASTAAKALQRGAISDLDSMGHSAMCREYDKLGVDQYAAAAAIKPHDAAPRFGAYIGSPKNRLTCGSHVRFSLHQTAEAEAQTGRGRQGVPYSVSSEPMTLTGRSIHMHRQHIE